LFYCRPDGDVDCVVEEVIACDEMHVGDPDGNGCAGSMMGMSVSIRIKLGRLGFGELRHLHAAKSHQDAQEYLGLEPHGKMRQDPGRH
jgi:hypothetical protein